MAQFIQKPGGKKVDLATTKYKTLQDAANAGYSPVSATPVPPKPTPTPTPAKTTLPEFYRVGIDIFEAGTERKIGATEWGKTWSGKATEVAAPTKPKVEPTITTPEVITTDLLKPDKETEGLIGEAKINQDYLDSVNQTIEKYGIGAGANKSFVEGVARTVGGDVDYSLVGKTLGQVIDAYELGDRVEGFGVQEAFAMPEGMEKIPHPELAKDYENISEDPTGTFLYGTPKVKPTPAGEAEPTPTEEAEPTYTPGEEVDNLYNELIAEKVEGMLEGVDVSAAMVKKQEANIAVEEQRQAIADKGLIDAVELEGIGEKPISMTLISRERQKYTQDEYITNLKMGMDYNNKLILARMAEGNFLEAQRISKDIANDVFEIRKLQLDQLMYQDKIKADEYARKQVEIEWERKLQFDYGYTYIPNIEAYNAIVKKYNITPANFDNFIYKEGDKMYLKDLEEAEDLKTEVITREDGTQALINTQTGEVIQEYGLEAPVKIDPADYVMRTDRHNNPIAVAMPTGGTNEFTDALDTAGIAWTEGDPFPDNPSMATIRFTDDGAEGSRVILSETGAIQNWYINHTGADILPKFNVKNNEDFKKLSKEDQDTIIQGIYNAEGGSGVLFREIADEIYPEDYEFSYGEKVDINRLPDLGGKVITDKTARGANLPYGITSEQANWIQRQKPGSIAFQALKIKDYDDLIGLFELRDDLAEIKALKEEVNTGWISTKLKGAQRFTGWESEDIKSFTSLEQKTGKQLAKYVKDISGAAVSEQEAQRLAKNIPNVDMQDEQFLLSLADYEDDIMSVIGGKLEQYDFENEEELRRAIMGREEVTPESDPLNLLNNNDPLGIL